MKRFLERLNLSAASLTRAAGILVLLLALDARAGNYCNNPVPPCDPNDPKSSCYKPPEPPPKCEPLHCDKCTKSPCYAGSGVYTTSVTDLELRTTGFPIALTRLYQSSHAIDGSSGYGWVSSLSSRLYYATYLKSAPSTYQREADVRMPDGALYRYVENGDGSFTPPEGRFDTLVRNPDGSWDLWLQRTRSHYHFSASGNLLEMVDDFGNTITWTYAADRVQRVEDASGSGRYIDITYGADGRISDVTDLTGRNVHYAYNTAGVLVAVTNPASQATTYTYASGKYVPLLRTVSDHWGRNVTTITYDAQDRVASYTEKGETYTYTYAYNGVSTTTAKSDSSGNRWEYPFGNGGLVNDSVPPGGGASEHVDYYANGLPQMHTDAVGVKTYYTYDGRGNRLTLIRDYQGPTAVEWRYTYDSNFPDNLVSEIAYTPGTNNVHPHWQGHRYDYYGPGSTAPGARHHAYRLHADGVTAELEQTFTYDSHGRMLTATDADGATTTYTYDSAGNLASVELPSNNDAGVKPTLTFGYDTLGRRTSSYDAAGHLTASTWDLLDRLTSQTLPKPTSSSTLTFTTTFVYDDFDPSTQLLFTRRVDPNGATNSAGVDQYDQVARTVDPAGNITLFTFVKGLLVSITDPNGNTTTNTYDARRRLQRITQPDGTYDQYTYYADNSIATIRDRKNQIVTFVYDRFKRTLSMTYPGGGAVTGTFQGEKLTQVVDTYASPSETHSLIYNDLFELTSNTEGARGTVSYTYTASGRWASASRVGGATVTYGYYPDGSIRTFTWSPVSGVFKYDYTLAGQTALITFPNGQTRTFGYDNQGRLTAVQNAHPTSGNIAAYVYGYDLDAFSGLPTRLGLRTSQISNVPALGLSSAVTKFGYDGRQQLTAAEYPSGAPFGGATASWTYDAAGNRTTSTLNGSTATYTYKKNGSNPLNWSVLDADGTNTYGYDANGNMTSRSGVGGNYTFTYDFENRLRTVAGPEAATYQYDHRDRRTATTVGGATTYHLYDGFNRIADIGSDPAEYLFGPGIDEPLAMARGGEIYYYAIDGISSVAALTDSSGTVVRSYAFDAWGELKGGGGTVSNPFGFTAREFSEAGLYNYRYRSYQPSLGSFRSVDPLIRLRSEAAARQGTAPGLLPDYLYVDNSPMMATDPLGLAPCEICHTNYKRAIFDCLTQYTALQLICTLQMALCIRKPPFIGCLKTALVCQSAAAIWWGRCKKNADRDFRDCIKGCDCPPPPPPPPVQRA